MHTLPRPRPCLLALLIALVGCGREADSNPAVSVWDSGGVRIVVTATPPALNAGGWRVAGSPVLSLGGGGEGAVDRLHRVVGGTVLSDGSVALATRGSAEIRLFDSRGTYRGALSGPRAWAGEGGSLMFMGSLGSDTLVTYDELHRRISRFHPEFGFLRSVELGQELPGLLEPIGVFADGRMLFRCPQPLAVGGGSGSGLFRERDRLFSLGPDGRTEEELGIWPGTEVWRTILEGNVLAKVIPFGKSMVATVGKDRFMVATGDRFEVEVLAMDGGRVQSMRLPLDPYPVTPEDGRRSIEFRVSRTTLDPTIRSRLVEEAQRIPLPEFTPTISDLHTDAEGNLWVEEYRRPWDSESVWTIFHPEGRAVGRVGLPMAVKVLDIGPDYILGLHIDSDGVERVHLFRLQRPAR